MNVLIKTTLNDAVHSRTVDVWTNFMYWFHFQWFEICCMYIYYPDCKVLFLRGEQKISSNFLRGSGTEPSVTKPVQTDT